MLPTKAIQVLDHYVESGGLRPSETTFNEAVKLGAEALKRVLLERKLGTYEMNYNLPGETED